MNTISDDNISQENIPTIVIVDNNEESLNSLRDLFKQSEYKLFLFTSAVSALQFLTENNVDIVISDMKMPEMRGSEFLKKSIDHSPYSIRIILSDYEEKSVIMNTISEGYAQHYILKPWADNELKKIVRNSIQLKNELHKKRIEDLLHSFGDLPAPPKMYMKLLTILQKDSKSQNEIAAEIEKNPELVVKLLRVSNSIYYGARIEISTVHEAITFIGTEAVLNLVLSLEAFGNLYKMAGKEVIRKSEQMRLTYIHRAQIARKIASQWHEPINPNEAYIAGLMLDIGFLLRFSNRPKDLNDFLMLYKESHEPAYYIDKKLFDVTHDEVGAALLKYWNFPEAIDRTVATHHSVIKNDELTLVAQLADYFVQGKDSLPHDPRIEEFYKEWKPKLTNLLNNTPLDDML